MKTKMTGQEYAALRGRSSAWVTRQVLRGMPAERVGKELLIETPAALDWEIERESRLAKQPPTQLNQERERLYREKANALAMQNAKVREDQMLRSQVEFVLDAMQRDLESELAADLDKLCEQIASTTSPAEIRQLLLTHSRQARRRLASKIRDAASAPAPRGGQCN